MHKARVINQLAISILIPTADVVGVYNDVQLHT